MNEILLKSYRTVRRPLNRLLNRFDPPVVVLLYHRVATLPADPEQLAVSPDNFRAQLQHLKATVPVVRFEEDWSRVSRPAVAVTFDDGYADNALQALPILEEVGVPATFFVSTATIDSVREFWWHEVEHIILEGSRLPPSFTLSDGPFQKKWPTSSDTERQVLYKELVRHLTDADFESREEVLRKLRHWARSREGVADLHRVMTLAELRLLAASRWATIGAHTVTHTRLSSLPPSAQRQEITTSKSQLESWLDREITVFSYPFGKRQDYTEETVALCREAGFTKAAANFPGQARRWTDPYRIPRMLVRNWSEEKFVKMLDEFWIK